MVKAGCPVLGVVGIGSLSCQVGFLVKAGSGHLSRPLGRKAHRKAHVSLTWAPKRNPLLVVRHTSLGALCVVAHSSRERVGHGGEVAVLGSWAS